MLHKHWLRTGVVMHGAGEVATGEYGGSKREEARQQHCKTFGSSQQRYDSNSTRDATELTELIVTPRDTVMTLSSLSPSKRKRTSTRMRCVTRILVSVSGSVVGRTISSLGTLQSVE